MNQKETKICTNPKGKVLKEFHKNSIAYRRYTLSDAAQLWLTSQKNYWKPGTYASYRQLLTKYILPYWGNIRLQKITNNTMEDFIPYLMLNSPKEKLSHNYMSQICNLVRRILTYSNTRYGSSFFVPVNPVSKDNFNQMILPDEAALFLLEQYLSAHCEEDTCLGILVAFHTGIRIGELSALTWNDINIEEEILYIRKNLLRIENIEAASSAEDKKTQIIEQIPKTSDSLRMVPIPPKLIPVLKKYKRESSMYVISGTRKPWAEPRTIQYRFKSILGKCNIEYFNFHLLRHAFATRCMAMGLDIKSLSEILGHSNIQITLNLYVHSSTQQKKMLMRQYDSLFQSGAHSI